jgi:hypothetical protein
VLAREHRRRPALVRRSRDNLWIRISRAGRSAADELSIFPVVFAVRATIATPSRAARMLGGVPALFFAEHELSAIDSCAEPAMLSVNR